MRDLAHGRDAGVVHVGQVAGDREAQRATGDRGGSQTVAHRPTAALIAASRPAASTAFRDEPRPTRNVRVDWTPDVVATVAAPLTAPGAPAPRPAATARPASA